MGINSIINIIKGLLGSGLFHGTAQTANTVTVLADILISQHQKNFKSQLLDFIQTIQIILIFSDHCSNMLASWLVLQTFYQLFSHQTGGTYDDGMNQRFSHFLYD